MIKNMDGEDVVEILNPSKISRDAKKRKVVNKMERKVYKIVYNNRVIQEGLYTLPYGY